MKEKAIDIISEHTSLDKESVAKMIESPPDPKLGDYAFPCFFLSKTLKKNPAEIAKEIVAKIKNNLDFEQIEATGPYVNFFVNRVHLANEVIKVILKQKDKFGSSNEKKKIILILIIIKKFNWINLIQPVRPKLFEKNLNIKLCPNIT